jgi:hypothetical protein
VFANALAFLDVCLRKGTTEHVRWRDVPIVQPFDSPEVWEGAIGQVDGESVEAIDVLIGWEEVFGCFKGLNSTRWACGSLGSVPDGHSIGTVPFIEGIRGADLAFLKSSIGFVSKVVLCCNTDQQRLSCPQHTFSKGANIFVDVL